MNIGAISSVAVSSTGQLTQAPNQNTPANSEDFAMLFAHMMDNSKKPSPNQVQASNTQAGTQTAATDVAGAEISSMRAGGGLNISA